MLFAGGIALIASALLRKKAQHSSAKVRLSLTVLQTLTERCVKAQGYSDKEVGLITDILLYAQVRMFLPLTTACIPSCNVNLSVCD